jgi:Glycosyl hydrolases family 28
MTQLANPVTTLEIYRYPRTCPKSRTFQVRVNGRTIFVYATGVADFASFSFAGCVEVEVEISEAIASTYIRPLSRQIQGVTERNKLSFFLEGPMNLQIEMNGLKPLHLYANPLEQSRPSSNDPSLLYFKGGQIYEVGRLELKDNQTLYLEGGAILKGSIFANRARNIRICGRGVIDGSYYRDEASVKLILLNRCEQVVLEDIIMIEPTTWMVVLGACRGVRISNLKQIGEVMSSDGIDVVGCRDVVIEGCFLKNNDDCVVIKSFFGGESTGEKFDWIEDVDNILVQNCVFMNDSGGNAMEIGYELRCDSIRNVTFRNIDVLHVHGLGAVFSIHNSDHATVGSILWEDIRIEHCYAHFIDFRVFQSMWSRDNQRGWIEDIRLKNIHWKRSIYNPGYTTSVIGGWNETQPIRNVVIEDLYFDNRKITSQDEIDLFTKSTVGLAII